MIAAIDVGGDDAGAGVGVHCLDAGDDGVDQFAAALDDERDLGLFMPLAPDVRTGAPLGGAPA